MTMKRIDPEFRIEADARIVAKAYAVYIDQLLDEIQKLHEEAKEEYLRREARELEREDVMFRFVLDNFGREKLLTMGRAIDEIEEKRTGINEGLVDYLIDKTSEWSE
jgi:hypothetical protein